jgi:tetratricopeptide (TPR) repeat protein
MSTANSTADALRSAIEAAARLVASDPQQAAAQAADILRRAPDHAAARLVLGAAHRSRGDAAAAIGVLESLVSARPDWVAAHYELGLAYGLAGRSQDAVAELRRALEIRPDMADAWRALGYHLNVLGDRPGAEEAYQQLIDTAAQDPRLKGAATALAEGNHPVAERLLVEHIARAPQDIAALRMLAEMAARVGQFTRAEILLERCLELAPGFTVARVNLAQVLLWQARFPESLRQVQQLLEGQPGDVPLRTLRAELLGRLGEGGEALELLRALIEERPDDYLVWHGYGHALKTIGRPAESVDAYRRTISLRPGYGEAYWSLANLKTFRFSDEDRARMLRQLERSDLSVEDRFHFHFALGKAFEDTGEYEQSFQHYAEGNRLRRSVIDYDAAEEASRVQRTVEVFTREFIESRAGCGATATDPIFIVGLPRAGSTLIEQILSSHSAVEGTMELPDIGAISRELGRRGARADRSAYPEILRDLDPAELRELGERYLETTRVQRKTGAPHFIDKNPRNWLHAGLIRLILPNAKIIDARRHPMSCCFAVFKQHFAFGNRFSYDLSELGAYYRNYVGLMSHFDAVMPGHVHRVQYESLVQDTEAEVRRLLDYCELPFEDACLRFYENRRAVRTASAEQVRQPIYRDALEQWTRYQPWLAPLEKALGPATDTHPS